ADPGHHELGLTGGDAPADLVEDSLSGARAGAPADGRDDAVGAVALAAVLDLHEPACTWADFVGLTRIRWSEFSWAFARQYIVLKVGAGAELSGDRRRNVLGVAAQRA